MPFPAHRFQPMADAPFICKVCRRSWKNGNHK